jgi:predicted metal-dependent enzyme (double-stranded beta helix superfamily)
VNAISPAPGRLLRHLLSDVAAAAQAPATARDRAIAAVLGAHMRHPGLLDGIACPCRAERYTRHLLGTGEGYAVLAITWRPGQMSPVHGHRTWCAFGVHRGWLTESFFAPAGTDACVPTGCRARRVGDTSHAAEGDGIHRLANLGVEPALSIHVYGAAFDRLGEEVNRVFAD